MIQFNSENLTNQILGSQNWIEHWNLLSIQLEVKLYTLCTGVRATQHMSPKAIISDHFGPPGQLWITFQSWTIIHVLLYLRFLLLFRFTFFLLPFPHSFIFCLSIHVAPSFIIDRSPSLASPYLGWPLKSSLVIRPLPNDSPLHPTTSPHPLLSFLTPTLSIDSKQVDPNFTWQYYVALSVLGIGAPLFFPCFVATHWSFPYTISARRCLLQQCTSVLSPRSPVSILYLRLPFHPLRFRGSTPSLPWTTIYLFPTLITSPHNFQLKQISAHLTLDTAQMYLRARVLVEWSCRTFSPLPTIYRFGVISSQ